MKKIVKYTFIYLFILIFINNISAEWVDIKGSIGHEAMTIIRSHMYFTSSSYIDYNGLQHIVFMNENGIWYIRWNGNDWVDINGNSVLVAEKIFDLSSDFCCAGINIRIDNNGYPHIIWENDDNIYYLKWNGSEWVDADGYGQESVCIYKYVGYSYIDQLSFELDSNGYPHIIWLDPSSGNFNIYYLKWNGSEWVDADGIGQESISVANTGFAYSSSLQLDNNGYPHIAWVNNNVYYLKWNGSEWVDADGIGRESIIVSNNAGFLDSLSLQLDNNGYPHIAWAYNNIYYLKWNGSEWVDVDGIGQESISVNNISVFNNIRFSGPSLQLDNNGYPHIAWVDEDYNYTKDNIYYLKWNGNEWVDADGNSQESIIVINLKDYHVFGCPPINLTLKLDNVFSPNLFWVNYHDEDEGGLQTINYLRWPTVSHTPTMTVTPNFTSIPVYTPTQTPSIIASDDSEIIVYPNPYKIESNKGLKFIFLAQESKVEIYTISGEYITSINPLGGIALWDASNFRGNVVAPGIYFYIIRDKNNSILKKGKVFLY
jgi:hypothetical protein